MADIFHFGGCIRRDEGEAFPHYSITVACTLAAKA